MAGESKVICKECGTSFKSETALHRHLKAHNMSMGEYYTTHYPRLNKLTQEPLPFKNKTDYFNTDFSTRAQMVKWCNQANKKEVKEYILRQLKNRVEQKQLKYAPNHLEVEINKLPPIELYKSNFGGYGQACKQLGLEPLYDKGIEQGFFRKNNLIEDIPVYVDTREQKPLFFKSTKEMKLDFGDYTMGGDNYSYTYVDRKSESDFKGTLGGGFKRFRNELQRAKDFDAYLYVVTEASIASIQKNNNFGPHRSNLSYLWHNMRLLTHEFKGHCQFIFTGNRRKSEFLIPQLLYHGQKLWGVDLQYFIDNKSLEVN